jgi:hypothetical protein
MTTGLGDLIAATAALVAGGIIGAGFGIVQEAARRRNERLQAAGRLSNGWAVMPGSGKRVAFLLIALVLVQVFCPLLFSNDTKWWVSGGVAVGYGGMLAIHLRGRLPLRRERR